MAGGQERILKRRIKSVQSTKKITRAMELIAASRIKKAEDRVRAAVPYSEAITEAVRDLAAAGGEVQSPLLAGREEVTSVAVIAITADRGLCGGYNSAVLRAAEGEIKEHVLAGRSYRLYCVGRKAESYFRFRGYAIAQSFTGFTDQPSYEDARRIARAVEAPFVAGDVDLVRIIYTRFVSAGTQEVVVRPIAPLEQEVVAGGDARPGHDGTASTYEFEPAPNLILDALLPRYVEARVYAALLNAAASEHAARQRAMKAATDNAEELVKTLSRLANRARQDAITTEIMEIVGGAEALRTGGHHTGPDQLLPLEMAAIGASSEA
ncbi:MAG: F0F1 ATP synthase subunit gamma [Acidimicrobiia bacterium]